ncbi:MAG: hypothetical protein HOP29_12685 [Phycisphaerales bacterium]|nr:hypothetical protein [Phycisphaerales bacterium]
MLALLYLTGPVASDDVLYLEIARDPTPPADPAQMSHGYGRVGFWLLLGLSRSLFGESWITFLPVPLLSAAGTLWLTARLARRWMNGRAAAASALFLGLLPLFIVYSTISLPDITAAFVTMAALSLLAPPLLNRDHRRSTVQCLLGGFVVGAGFSVKESVIFLCPSLALFVLLTWPRCAWAWRRLFLIAVGAALGLSAEMAVLWYTTGNPLYHFESIRVSQENAGTPVADNTWRTILFHSTEYVRMLATGRDLFGAWGPLYLAAAGYALVRGTHWARLLLCCLFVVGSYLSVGTSDLKHYFPLYHQARYLIPLAPPAVLLTVHLIVDVLSHRPRLRKMGIVALAAIAAHSMWLPNGAAGNAYLAGTFRAAELLFAEPFAAADPSSGIVASSQSTKRIWLTAAQAGAGSPEIVTDPSPGTSDAWTARYGGRCVWVTALDRDRDRQRRGGVLTFDSQAALQEFELVVSAAPPRNRLNAVFAWLGLVDPLFDARQRIDVYRIPMPDAATPTGQFKRTIAPATGCQ